MEVGETRALMYYLTAGTRADNPTGLIESARMRGLIGELSKRATVIVSTHVLQEVQAVCERVLILRAGRLVVDSRIDALQQADGLLVTVDRDMGERLTGLPQVRGVTPTAANGRFGYLVNAPIEVAPEVARAVAEAGGALYALEPRRRDLETVFASVNEESPRA
jgi:ABC-2 type transport system ATP-binding protein